MARIKIKDLPKDQKISREELKKVIGGLLPISSKFPGGPLQLASMASSPPGGIYNPSFSPLAPGTTKGIIIVC